MILIKALVLLFAVMSGTALLSSAVDWAFYEDRAGWSLTAASGFLFVFWVSVYALLASR